MAENGRRKIGTHISGTGLSDSTEKDAPITKLIVTLECGHVEIRDGRPNTTDAYCLKCGKLTDIKSVCVQYHLKCCECTYGRSFGADRMTCHTRALDHHHKRGHTVRVLLDDLFLYYAGQDENQLALLPEEVK